MATKLKNLKVRKVDFVDEGANPEAHIKLVKRKDKEAPVKDCGEKGNGSILKRLLGFIGRAAGIEQEEIDSVVEEIQKSDSISFNEKINEVNNRKIADEMWDVCYALQSALCSILNDEELDSAKTQTAMKESLEEFHVLMEESIQKWSDGKEAGIVRKEKVTKEELDVMKAERDRLTKSINDATSACADCLNNAANACVDCLNKAAAGQEETAEQETVNENPKGEEEMKIDKSKMTPAELAFLDSIEKRYGTEETGNLETAETGIAAARAGMAPASAGTVKVPEVPLAKLAALETVAAVQGTPEPDDIYKGLHPAVKAELEGLKKFKEIAEDRELSEIAKKYAIIGKKEEELVSLFKSLKAAGGTAYNDMIAVLDQAVNTVEKSGVFSEIGKLGHFGENSAETKISGIAKGYMEKDPSLSYNEAVAKAWEDNPDILNEYDEEAGF